MIPEMKPVESSNIAALGHKPENNTMFVQFKYGTMYSYQNVPAELFNSILNAESVGKAFNEKIKVNPQTYPYQKV